MSEKDFLSALSDLLDEKLEEKLDKILDEKLEEKLEPINNRLTHLEKVVEPMSDRLTRLERAVEYDIVPRLRTIESCYLATSERYLKSAAEHEGMKQDIEVLKLVVENHSQRLLQTS
ncbi:MAG: hypothetical protein IJZ82_10805 [Lachnospiraceae bacterium]|nr:hypothetical protein [Lachnospiraceae bacterium]